MTPQEIVKDSVERHLTHKYLEFFLIASKLIWHHSVYLEAY